MTDKQIKEELKQVVTNLGNIEFTVEDELKFCKEILKHKEQECEELKEGYSELTEIVSPYMDDFTGYNEELGGFDIVLCVKQLVEQLDQLKAENEELKEELEELKEENEYNEANAIEFKQTLTEIKEIAYICCKTTDCKKV